MNKLTQKNITEINVDDYIRQQKRKGIRTIHWTNKTAWKALRKFARYVLLDLNYRLPRTYPNDVNFLGVRHFNSTKR